MSPGDSFVIFNGNRYKYYIAESNICELMIYFGLDVSYGRMMLCLINGMILIFV